jgi:hypothetical protein
VIEVKNKNLVLTAVIAIVVGGLSFFGGIKYQQSKQPKFFREFTGQQGQRQPPETNSRIY